MLDCATDARSICFYFIKFRAGRSATLDSDIRGGGEKNYGDVTSRLGFPGREASCGSIISLDRNFES